MFLTSHLNAKLKKKKLPYVGGTECNISKGEATYM